MREYGAVSPRFWIGETGKQLRTDGDAQRLAMYLMTSPHSNMIGIYHCPILYMSHETGIPFEGASKALQRLCELDYCTFDPVRDVVFVHTMAHFQVGESLKVDDKRRIGVIRQLDEAAHPAFRRAFLERYAAAYKVRELLDSEPPASPIKAPSKQLTETGPGQDHGQEQDHGQGQATRAKTESPDQNDRPGRAEACTRAMKAGISGVNPSHPAFLAALDEGATPDEIEATAIELAAIGKRAFSYLIATVRSRRAEAAANPPQPGARNGTSPRPRKLSAVEQVQQSIIERRERERTAAEATVVSTVARRTLGHDG